MVGLLFGMVGKFGLMRLGVSCSDVLARCERRLGLFGQYGGLRGYLAGDHLLRL